jgi:L-lactate dehydrogenase complex protein LldG
LFPDARVVCSAAREVAGNRELERVRTPAELNDVDVGVARAVFGVAETGSGWLSEAELKVNALGFLSQHLVVVLDPIRIVDKLHHAYRDRVHLKLATAFYDRPIGDRRYRGRPHPRR